jgi:dTDP-4-amino-4,6-dideoxygalactose transaminase
LGSHQGRKCGTFEILVLFFNGVKLLQLGGGAIITSSLALKKKAIFLATQAREEAPHYQHIEIAIIIE